MMHWSRETGRLKEALDLQIRSIFKRDDGTLSPDGNILIGTLNKLMFSASADLEDAVEYERDGVSEQ